jgi:DNA polymerase-3 subunit gamma/tau
MSAIYQRARPIRWDQVVGQEHVKDVLRAALEQGRVGHAYLFSGPRGVGKTTTARLIAMTANCETPGIKPCGECESCLSVRAGNHPDVLEIDAASNNSVDDVRELREKVGLSAMRGGKKIYILDEAHMMSRAAFNALLKTLEEPPEHVIFILATTEPEKIIPTILSRCQHYRFRRLTPEEIGGKLAGIAQKEGVTAEPEALQLLGRLADGAMRDGESLLERMLAAGSAVTRAGVEAALGLPPGEQMRSMAAALVQQDAAGLLEGAAGLYRAGYAARTVVEGLVTALGQALHAELGIDGAGTGRLEGADVPRLLRLQAALDAQDSRFARGADLQSLELALTHALIAGDGTAGGSAQSAGSSAGSLAAPSADVTQRLARLEKELRDLRAAGGPVQSARPMTQPVASALDEIPSFDAAQRAPARAAAPVPVAPPAQGDWTDVVRLASSQTKAFLKPAQMHAQQGYVSLHYSDKNTFHAKQMVSKFEELSKLVTQIFGPVMLEITGPTPDSSKKAQVGGKAGAGVQAAVQQVAVSSQTVSAPARSAALNPPDEIPSFAEARDRRADVEPARDVQLERDAQPERKAALAGHLPAAEIPEFAPARRSAPVANPVSNTAAAPTPAHPGPPQGSLDDRAPAPLPEQAANFDGHGSQTHAAAAPPSPADAGPPDIGPPDISSAAEPVARETRSVYIAPEPIFEEPDWDDLGLSPDMPPAPNVVSSAAPKTAPVSGSLAQAAAAGLPLPAGQPPIMSPQRLPAQTVRPDDVQPTPPQQSQAQQPQAQQPQRQQTRPVPVQAASDQPDPTRTAPQPASAAVSGLQDLRAHPLYQEATKMWAGRVREVGKVKPATKAEAETEMDLAEVLADEELV